jgi:regulatory protein
MGPGNSHDARRVAPRPIYDQALRLLEFRPRSVAELRKRLLQKGGDSVEVDRVIDRLREQKLLDDVSFAREFARMRITGAGSSRHRIVQELRRKGVAGAIADEAVAGLQEREGIDPLDAVHKVAEKKWRAMSGLDDLTRRRRLYAFLARRGFNPDEIRTAIDRVATRADEAS